MKWPEGVDHLVKLQVINNNFLNMWKSSEELICHDVSLTVKIGMCYLNYGRVVDAENCFRRCSTSLADRLTNCMSIDFNAVLEDCELSREWSDLAKACC